MKKKTKSNKIKKQIKGNEKKRHFFSQVPTHKVVEESPKIGNHQNKETTLHLKEISNPYQNTKSETGSAGSGIKLGNKGEWIAEETEKKKR